MRDPCLPSGRFDLIVSTLIALVLLSPILLVNLVFVVELLAGLGDSKEAPLAPSPLAATIVVPAHNEGAGISRTLSELVGAAQAADCSILVVADNCHDETAAIARSFPVQVIERFDEERRGKGYALAFARDWLSRDEPAAVIILDADCRSDAASLKALVTACLKYQRPAQAINLLLPSLSSTAMVQVSTFAFLLKNKLRQRGLQRLAGEVHLTGTGMALPWSIFATADLATSSIVEDLRLGFELSARGSAPLLVQDSYVWSPHAPHEATMRQRQRWEGGFLSVAGMVAPGLILAALKSGSAKLALRGLDLIVPPLALLGLLNAAALVFLAVLATIGLLGVVPLLTLAGVAGSVALTLFVAWLLEGQAYLSARALLHLPLYALWKVPMYLGLARKGAPAEWRRTDRDGEIAD